VPKTIVVGPSLTDFEDARRRVFGVAELTPVETSRYLADLLGAPVYLKCENLQRTGSYKIRGAYNRISRLSDEEKARGVVAASAGNHAQGVAFAARELGIKATIFMPVGVALPKLQATKDYGADVVLRGYTVEEPLRAAAEFAKSTGAVLIPPFDHEDVVAGQGTVGLEIFDQVPDVETVIVPIGGGGLISGVASAIKQRAALEGRTIRVIGVQAANAAAYSVSLAAGVATEITMMPTISDGIAVSKPGLLNFEIVREFVDEVVNVTEGDTAQALLTLLERAKLVVEPAGAVRANRRDGADCCDSQWWQHRPTGDGACDQPRSGRLRAVPEASHSTPGPARPTRSHCCDHCRGERQRCRSAAHASRQRNADQPGRTGTPHRDPWAGTRGASARAAA